MNNQTGIYIHFPYCEKKCPYCDFNSHVVESIPHKKFEEAFIKDFENYLAHLITKPEIISIFFGGGTPSLMQPSSVDFIISYICSKLEIEKSSIEITLEANPSSFEIEKFRDFKKAGVNRISIGVQSFIDNDLKKLGRVHNSSAAKKAITQARQIFDKFSFDLIYARQNQEIENWKTELTESLKEFQPNHISLYSLTIEKGTKFFTLHKDGKLEIPKNQEEFYDVTNEICSSFDLHRYEISNYAKNKNNECLHNILYWQGGQYLGVGPGAHGRINTKDGRIATVNFHSPEKYLKLMETKGDAIQNWEILNAQTKAIEIISTGLRTIYGLEISEITKPFLNFQSIKVLEKENIIILQNNRIIPTEKGLSLCDGIVKFIVRYQ